jgi:mono/diheme cytochrome c family protein
MVKDNAVPKEDLMRARLPWGWVELTATAIVAATLAIATEPTQAVKVKLPDGASLYVAYCASCHGRSGRGDGPVAEYLKIPPADLTGIASRAKGVFPAYEAGRIIDGRQIVRAHGDAAMPVWGDAFRSLSPEIGEAEVRARIDALVKYLEAMQPRQASNTGARPAVAR